MKLTFRKRISDRDGSIKAVLARHVYRQKGDIRRKYPAGWDDTARISTEITTK